EWLPSTPKHLQLYDALGLPRPEFAHLPLLINPDGSKLSKRTGDVKVEDYIDKGYEPEALLNFVALLGWSPQSSDPTPSSATEETSCPSPSPSPDSTPAPSQATDLLPLSSLISQFSLSAINKNRPTLPQGKLDWLNRNHVKLKLVDSSEGADERRTDLARRVGHVVRRAVGEECGAGRDREYYLAVVDALKDRLHTINDIPSLGRYFFVEPDYSTPVSKKMYKAMKAETYRATLNAAIPIVASLPDEVFSRSIRRPGAPADDDVESRILVALSSISIETPSSSSAPSLASSPSSTVSSSSSHGSSSSSSDMDRPSMSPSTRQKASETMSPLRHALTGQKVGASVAATVRVLGREATRERLERAVRWSEEQ
ncbi:hypothetical protein JCM10212_004527, partial [Sporobolomyces blumeae]